MKKKIVFGVLAVILLLAGYVAMKFYGAAVSTPAGEFFYIKTGATYDEVKEDLVNKKFIESSFWFDKASSLLRFKNVKPGRYKLKKGMSMVSLIRMLRAGDQQQLNFVITKIRTKEVLASKVGKVFECDSVAMINFLNNEDSLRPFGLDTATVMAVALPLTYSINWNSTPSKIFRQFYTAYETFWNNQRKQQADSLGLSPIGVITLASIIEEETNKKADKYNIASVYINRIKQGIPLQADPTVKFAMRDFGLKRVLHVHLEYKSPYNTYLNRGLPPGPICTPSVETIEAVLNAPQTNYLYFVASHRFDGSSVFATSLSEHLGYARLYQQELTIQMKKRDSINKAKQLKQ